MGKTLVLAEKPSVGRDIAKVLGCRQRGDGCVFGEDHIISWAVGHLVTLASPEELDDKYKEWSFETLPILPDEMKLKVLPNVQKQFNIVRHWMNDDQVEQIICATDSGREGELIFRRIYEMCGCKKPFERLWISSMTDEAIRDGFARLKPGKEYDNLYASARCRADADWLVGMNGSRGFTLAYNTLLSVGRVQSPTLSIIVSRELERQRFQPEEYYELWATFTGYKGCWFDESATEYPTRIPVAQKEKFEQLALELKGKPAVVEKVEREKKTTLPPLLYDLTELQRDANRHFGWPASKTLRVAQILYEKRKVITYPRTDSRYLSRDLLRTLKGRLSKLQNPNWDPFIPLAVASERNLFGRVINDARVSDHHAILPTGRTLEKKGVTEDELALFDLVVRRLIAIFLDDQIAEHMRVLTRCEGHAFESKGKTILQAGWSDLYANLTKAKRGKADDESLPQLKEGDKRKVSSAKFALKQTEPPPPYTEASLLSAMEHAGRLLEDEELREQMKDSGLGTPATRAAIIERLIQVGYIRRRGKILVPTEKGILLIKILPEAVASPETTGRWEMGLAQIGKGEKDAEMFMKEIRSFVIDIVSSSKTKMEGVSFPTDVKAQTSPRGNREVLGVCPSCSGQIMENSKAYFCSQWKQGCRFTLWKNALEKEGGPILTPDLVRMLLEKKKLAGHTGTMALKRGKPYIQWEAKDGEGAPSEEGELVEWAIPDEQTAAETAAPDAAEGEA